MKQPQASVRYYARFRGLQGKVRAVVYYQRKRYFITTPLIITKSQLEKFSSNGDFAPDLSSTSDCIFYSRLRSFALCFRRVITPLAESGALADLTSADLQKAIQERLNAERAADIKQILQEQGIDASALPAEAFVVGSKMGVFQSMALYDFIELVGNIKRKEGASADSAKEETKVTKEKKGGKA